LLPTIDDSLDARKLPFGDNVMKIHDVSRILIIFLSLCLMPFAFHGESLGISANQHDPSHLIVSNGIQELQIVQATYKYYLPVVLFTDMAHYVSPQGNDSNPGTYLLPWRTIQKAANSVDPGDLVYLHGGTYHEYVSVNRSGTQALPIKFQAFPGEYPVLDGQNTLPNTEDGLFTIDGSWVEVKGLEVKNSNYVGMSLYGHHNTLTDVYVHHSFRSGVYLSGDYNIIQDSRVWRNSMHNEFGVDTGSSGIVASQNPGITEYPIIRRNVVWENWGQGINVHHANYVVVEDNTSYDNFTANIYIHDITNVLCQRNFFYMNPSNTYMGDLGPKVGILMGEEYSPPKAENIQVINNVVYGNHRNLFWYTGDMGGGMTNVLFANNTFVNGTGVSSGNCNIILDPAVNVNVRFINNIVIQDTNLDVIYTVSDPNVTFSHNLWSELPITAARGPGDVIGDPKLAKMGTPFTVDWFRLLSSSPAINAGLALPEVLTDYFGNLRGGSPDIGAIEYFP
jgi:hypothetical protein